MAQLIEVSIKRSKITKEKIYKGKDGEEYLNLIISVNDETDRFGQDVAVYEKQSDEEKTAKANKNFVGNGKTFWVKGDGMKTAKDKTGGQVDTKAPAAPPTFDYDDDLPF